MNLADDIINKREIGVSCVNGKDSKVGCLIRQEKYDCPFKSDMCFFSITFLTIKNIRMNNSECDYKRRRRKILWTFIMVAVVKRGDRMRKRKKTSNSKVII